MHQAYRARLQYERATKKSNNVSNTPLKTNEFDVFLQILSTLDGLSGLSRLTSIQFAIKACAVHINAAPCTRFFLLDS